ncbi:MAG: 2-isopropylmalate synthase [Candidatus Adiutrix intracellularis]|jgi:2-isopropylmalate synthase|nr:MAG: 2-isopropylmalate synthase [Candidatus Adiutrix intracellularis]MDR2826613.1 2-isopropylmalate synthase [Candidatus Adiutrix intracellularis]
MFDSRRVTFFDTTLRDGEQAAGVNLNTLEKLQIARQLARMRIDVIEAGFPATSPGDFNCVKAIAWEVKGVTVAALARTKEGDIRAAAQALANAERSRIHIFIATSPIHMVHKLRMTPEQVLSETRASVSLASSLADEVEFSAEDASRSDPDFLISLFKLAVDCGATILNIPDTVGYAIPDEFRQFCRTIIDGVAASEGVIFSVHTHDDLGLAVANSLAAVRAGVRQVEGTVNGMGERGGNAALEEVAMALATRADIYNLTIGLDTTRLYPVSRLVSKLSGVMVPPNKAIVGANAFAHESGIHQHGVLVHRETYEIMKAEDVGSVPAVMVLGKHSGRHAFRDRLESLGYQLDDEQISRSFNIFKCLCDEKKDVTDGDIEAIISDQVLTVNPEHRFELVDYAVSVGTGLATATVVVRRDAIELRDAATGNGPIDSAYNAIKRAIDFHPELHNFSIRATSSRSDALGETVVELKYGEITAQGRGAATDIVKASIQAYLNAVNRLYTQAAAREIKLEEAGGNRIVLKERRQDIGE